MRITMSLIMFAAPITFILTILQSVNCNQRFYFLQKSASKADDILPMVRLEKLNIVPYILSRRDKIGEALRSVNPDFIYTITEDQMREYFKDRNIENDIYPEESRKIVKAYKSETTERNSGTATSRFEWLKKWEIFPGTKWCGAGNIAENYYDLGEEAEADRCCRAHDFCNGSIASGDTRHNLTNTAYFTQLSCECDEDFYNCLHAVNGYTADTIGEVYFSILNQECYELDYPIKECKKSGGFWDQKCLEYVKDKSAPKVYQWVSVKEYY